MIRGWTHLKTDHAGQNHSPHLQFCPVSKEARTQQWPHRARATTVTTKQQREKEEEKVTEGKTGCVCGGGGGGGGDNLASSHSSTECQLLK